MKYKIAISLLALNNINNIERFFKLLNQNNIKYIELPISKIFKNYEFNKNKLLKFKNLLNKYDLKVSSIQSIFFGRTELNIFNTSQNKLIIEHLIKVLKISKFLGAKNLIFGSPINRYFLRKKKF